MFCRYILFCFIGAHTKGEASFTAKLLAGRDLRGILYLIDDGQNDLRNVALAVHRKPQHCRMGFQSIAAALKLEITFRRRSVEADGYGIEQSARKIPGRAPAIEQIR